MAKQVDSIVRIPCKVNDKFFNYWFEFLKPFHNLTGREILVATELVKERFELSKVIKDNDILDKVTMSKDTKEKIRERCEISWTHFQVIMGKLRKNKIIIDGKLNPRYIPIVDEESGSFKMMLLFDFT